MIAFFSLFFCVLFAAGGGGYGFYALVLRGERRSRGLAVFHGLFALTLVLQGLAFSRYYPYHRFSFLPTMLFITCAYGGAVLAYWFDPGFPGKIISLSITAVELFLAAWKLAAFDDLPAVARLPLNVCNILVIFMLLRFFVKSPALDNYILCFGILAALVNYVTGAFYDNLPRVNSGGLGFFYYKILESAVLHNLFLVYCVYGFLRRLLIVDVRRALWNMVWITPLFIVFSFCNQLWRTDYFFTGVYGVTPPALIALYHAMPLRFSFVLHRFVFEVNPLYYALILGAAGLTLLVLSSVLRAVQSRLPGIFGGRGGMDAPGRRRGPAKGSAFPGFLLEVIRRPGFPDKSNQCLPPGKTGGKERRNEKTRDDSFSYAFNVRPFQRPKYQRAKH